MTSLGSEPPLEAHDVAILTARQIARGGIARGSGFPAV